MHGSKSPDWMRRSAQQLARVLPQAEHRTLAGQNHMLKATAVAPELVEFFGR